ncbi:MAG TPA: DUF4157 domain-containing protein [Thermoanaerobaculia bacterium]|nr:DUF4157 domain-containing protein [Thermoanaerobaculia bacterium]
MIAYSAPALPGRQPQVIQGFFAGGRLRVAPPRAGAAAVQLRLLGSAAQLPSESPVLLSQSAGQRLPEVLQRKMEEAFGASFSDVRIHVGHQAAVLGAFAFTHGANLYFAPGQYLPNSPHGQRLLAHELAHVVQQRAGRVRNPFGSGVAVVQDPALEAEAERLALKATTARPPLPVPVAKPCLPVPAGSRLPSLPVQPKVDPRRSFLVTPAPHVQAALASLRPVPAQSVQPKIAAPSRIPVAPAPPRPYRNVVFPGTVQRMKDDDEYIPEEEKYDPDEYVRATKSRGLSFYSETRKELTEEQTRNGTLYSGKDGTGPMMKMKKYNNKLIEDRKYDKKPHQPSIDHVIDWLVLEKSMHAKIEEEDMSDAELEEFKKYTYSYKPNLQILSKGEDLKKKRYREDTVPSSLKDKSNLLIKQIHKGFYDDAKVQKKREGRRKKLKKKKG